MKTNTDNDDSTNAEKVATEKGATKALIIIGVVGFLWVCFGQAYREAMDNKPPPPPPKRTALK